MSLRHYRSKPTEVMKLMMELASRSRLYLLQTMGPTAFVLGDDNDKKYKVRIGESIMCSCKGPKEEGLCLHTFFVMLKVLSVSSENPIIWQSSLIDREITEIVSGRTARLNLRSRRSAAASAARSSEEDASGQRELSPDDPCPICQDDMMDPATVVWCKTSCGNNVHRKCLVKWRDHRKSIGEDLTCPMCRAEWKDEACLKITDAQARREITMRNSHAGTSCRSCRESPICGTLYRCNTCRDYDMCSKCYFERNTHTYHNFQKRESSRAEWEPAESRTQSSSQQQQQQQVEQNPQLPLALIRELEGREISPEDYDTLMQLHAQNGSQQNAVPRMLLETLPRFPYAHTLATSRAVALAGAALMSDNDEDNGNDEGSSGDHSNCVICMSEFAQDEMLIELPCAHAFHEGCIENWLLAGRNTCPIDNGVVFSDDVIRDARAALADQASRAPHHQHQHQQPHQPHAPQRQPAGKGKGRRAGAPGASSSSNSAQHPAPFGSNANRRLAALPPQVQRGAGAAASAAGSGPSSGFEPSVSGFALSGRGISASRSSESLLHLQQNHDNNNHNTMYNSSSATIASTATASLRSSSHHLGDFNPHAAQGQQHQNQHSGQAMPHHPPRPSASAGQLQPLHLARHGSPESDGGLMVTPSFSSGGTVPSVDPNPTATTRGAIRTGSTANAVAESSQGTSIARSHTVDGLGIGLSGTASTAAGAASTSRSASQRGRLHSIGAAGFGGRAELHDASMFESQGPGLSLMFGPESAAPLPPGGGGGGGALSQRNRMRGPVSSRAHSSSGTPSQENLPSLFLGDGAGAEHKNGMRGSAAPGRLFKGRTILK